MNLSIETFEKLKQTCITENVYLLLDTDSSVRMIMIKPEHVSQTTYDGSNVVWPNGVISILAVNAVRVGGKPGEFLKEVLGEAGAERFNQLVWGDKKEFN